MSDRAFLSIGTSGRCRRVTRVPIGATLLLAVIAAAVPQMAVARVKPKIMILFDTSGSMLDRNDRDGSPLCSNRGQNSNIYRLKRALFDVLQGIGATEVDFALSTFPMFVDATRTPECADTCNSAPSPYQCSGHYYVTNAQDSEYSSYLSACKVSSHTPSSQKNANCGASSNPCSAWYSDYKKEVLRIPFGKAPEQVMLYFDQREDTNSTAPLSNPEVRASGGWYTPLGKSLFYAHGYFHKDVALPSSDYRKKCERLVIAFFTDGAETCNTQTSDAFYPTKWAANLYNNLKVVTHTVAINTSATLIRSIASAGKGTYTSVASDTNALKKAFLDIIAKSQPPSESCNNADDDCDGKTDEDFPQKGKACNNGKLGICYATGTYVCKSDGTGVTCKTSGGGTKTTEVCNGKDDDCDGQVDEGLTSCVCVKQPEVCNGKDDDCDGKTDEGLSSTTCGKNIGECKAGTSKCTSGKLVCSGGKGPSTEKCDGLDNDCDGQRDNLTRACYPYTTGCDAKTGVCKGICKLGTQSCTASQSGSTWKGTWGKCTGAVGPAKEVCDGVDNDCDGKTDEGAECPGSSQCIAGQCTKQCSGTEFACPPGQLCKNGWCIRDTCDRNKCEAQGFVCKSGQCIDPCKGITCKSNEKCVRGICEDQSCYAKGCPSGQRCVQGKCTADPCKDVASSCGDDEFCADGTCVKLCETMTCPKGQRCELVTSGDKPQTKCVDDKCAGVICNQGYGCVAGSCKAAPCVGVVCGLGQKCYRGKCEADLCEKVSCPRAYTCERGVCVSAAKGTDQVLATGGGGLACAVGGTRPSGSPPLSLLLLLGLVICRLSRRRRDR